jgi:hypothetical protein
MHVSGPGFQGTLPQKLRIAADQVRTGARVAEIVGRSEPADGIIRTWIASSPIDGK